MQCSKGQISFYCQEYNTEQHLIHSVVKVS